MILMPGVRHPPVCLLVFIVNFFLETTWSLNHTLYNAFLCEQMSKKSFQSKWKLGVRVYLIKIFFLKKNHCTINANINIKAAMYSENFNWPRTNTGAQRRGSNFNIKIYWKNIQFLKLRERTVAQVSDEANGTLVFVPFVVLIVYFWFFFSLKCNLSSFFFVLMKGLVFLKI